MTDGTDAAKDRLPSLKMGYTLLWTIEPAADESALQRATAMGLQAEAHVRGTWGVAERGLGGGQAFFDLTLEEDVDALLIKLAFGRLPDAVY